MLSGIDAGYGIFQSGRDGRSAFRLHQNGAAGFGGRRENLGELLYHVGNPGNCFDSDIPTLGKGFCSCSAPAGIPLAMLWII